MKNRVEQYELRILDISSLRQTFYNTLNDHYQDPQIQKLRLMKEEGVALEWIIEEVIQRLFNCRVNRHYKYDLGQYVLDITPMIVTHLKWTLEPTRLYERSGLIEHVKVMTLGDILTIATLFK